MCCHCAQIRKTHLLSQSNKNEIVFSQNNNKGYSQQFCGEEEMHQSFKII